MKSGATDVCAARHAGSAIARSACGFDLCAAYPGTRAASSGECGSVVCSAGGKGVLGATFFCGLCGGGGVDKRGREGPGVA